MQVRRGNANATNEGFDEAHCRDRLTLLAAWRQPGHAGGHPKTLDLHGHGPVVSERWQNRSPSSRNAWPLCSLTAWATSQSLSSASRRPCKWQMCPTSMPSPVCCAEQTAPTAPAPAPAPAPANLHHAAAAPPAAAGLTGLVDPVEPGLACGSDTAHLSIFGYDPRKYYRGRGAFESMGAGGSDLLPEAEAGHGIERSPHAISQL
jgi:hypothetical protein